MIKLTDLVLLIILSFLEFDDQQNFSRCFARLWRMASFISVNLGEMSNKDLKNMVASRTISGLRIENMNALDDISFLTKLRELYMKNCKNFQMFQCSFMNPIVVSTLFLQDLSDMTEIVFPDTVICLTL